MINARLQLGIIIAAPITFLTGLFYIIPFSLLGWYTYAGKFKTSSLSSSLGSGWVWTYNPNRGPRWLSKKWEGWGGHCVGSTIVIKESKLSSKTLEHELHHVHQMHTFGVLQVAIYYFASALAWAANEKAYEANVFEVAARRAAGQIADSESFAQGYAWCKGGNAR